MEGQRAAPPHLDHLALAKDRLLHCLLVGSRHVAHRCLQLPPAAAGPAAGLREQAGVAEEGPLPQPARRQSRCCTTLMLLPARCAWRSPGNRCRQRWHGLVAPLPLPPVSGPALPIFRVAGEFQGGPGGAFRWHFTKGVAEVAAAAAVAAGKEETRTSGESAACAMCRWRQNGALRKPSSMHLISKCLRCFAAAKALLGPLPPLLADGRWGGDSFPCLWEL